MLTPFHFVVAGSWTTPTTPCPLKAAWERCVGGAKHAYLISKGADSTKALLGHR